MDPKILRIARRKFKKLSRVYDGFLNVIVEDWRGYRFVYDTVDTRKCDNLCAECPLYKLLRNEKEDLFSAELYLANKEDKKLFGPQKFLNCKTLSQYRDCYVSFLIKKTQTEEEIIKELKLINNFKIIYSKEGCADDVEKKFRESIYKKAMRLSGQRKRRVIENFLRHARQYLNSIDLLYQNDILL